MAQTCSCSCHPHTQWGPDGSDEQRANHPTEACCVCCREPSPRWPQVVQEMHAEGFFASEQERVAEEQAWHDEHEASHLGITGDLVVPGESEGESPGAEVVLAPAGPVVRPAEGEGEPGADEGVDPPVDPLDIPDHYDLPPYGVMLMCPKCRHERIGTTYHAHGVLSGPCGTRFGWPDIQNLGEHLCRECGNCGYGWPESVAHGA